MSSGLKKILNGLGLLYLIKFLVWMVVVLVVAMRL